MLINMQKINILEYRIIKSNSPFRFSRLRVDDHHFGRFNLPASVEMQFIYLYTYLNVKLTGVCLHM